LIITHRFSTIEHADEVVVLDRGRVVKRGPHWQLLTQQGLHHRYAAGGLARNTHE
jgi:ABC-type multidrug transport system fused ATPase/permease subunit